MGLNRDNARVIHWEVNMVKSGDTLGSKHGESRSFYRGSILIYTCTSPLMVIAFDGSMSCFLFNLLVRYIHDEDTWFIDIFKASTARFLQTL